MPEALTTPSTSFRYNSVFVPSFLLYTTVPSKLAEFTTAVRIGSTKVKSTFKIASTFCTIGTSVALNKFVLIVGSPTPAKGFCVAFNKLLLSNG